MTLSAGFWTDEERELIKFLLPSILRAVAQGSITAGEGLELAGISVDWQLINSSVTRAAEEFVTKLSAQVTKTNLSAFTSEFSSWLESGESLSSLVDSLSAYYSPVKASQIAVTETTRAFAEGNIVTWRDAKLKRQRYRTVMDDVVCPICEPLENEVFTLGDSSGTPPLHVNCILPGNEVVVPGHIEAATKSFYDGPCVEITLANGSQLTVTQKHQVLTRHGWLDAGIISKGDDLICASDTQRIAASINPDNDNMPTYIEKVFAALKMTPGMFSAGMPVSPEDFNIDGSFMNGDVEVISANSILRTGMQSQTTEHFCQSKFNRNSMALGTLIAFGSQDDFGFGDNAVFSSFMGGSRPAGALGIRHLRPLERFSFRLSSNMDIGSKELSTNCCAVDAEQMSDGILRFPRQIEFNHFISNMLANLSRFPYASFFQTSIQGLRRDIHLTSQFTDRFASLITSSEVIKVRNFNFSGHVYDLQVNPYQLYITNGIIVHNCRCWLTPVMEDDNA